MNGNEDVSAFVVDRGSSVRSPNDEELRTWGEERSVFVSGVMSEFEAERMALRAMIEHEIGATAILFEGLGGRDEDAQQAYLDGVRRSDIYLGVVGDRYGTMTETGRSATHEEYREATGLGKRISVWVKADGSQRQGNARDFVEEVRVFHTTGSFTGQDDLVGGVRSRLVKVAGDDLSPWVKLGPVLFRVRRIEDSEHVISLEATVRDAEVTSALLELRSQPWGQVPVRFTDHTDSHEVLVNAVNRSTSSTALTDFTIRLEKRTGYGGTDLGRYTFQQRGPDDLVELGLRRSLFGEPLPADLAGFGELAVPEFSLAAVESLSPDAAAAVARVLLVDQLVGRGHAQSVSTVHFGGGQRRPARLRVEWVPPDVGGSRSAEGDLVSP